MPLTYIDLFAGAGGLSEGFRSRGFTPIAHVEMMPEACMTLKTRECYYHLKGSDQLKLYRSYLNGSTTQEELYGSVPEKKLNSVINISMNQKNMGKIFQLIDRRINQKNGQGIDVLVGGPPCQAYSLVGRARSKTKMVGDPRNYLYKLYAEVLKKYMPKVFVFENVPGLLSANNSKYFMDMKNEFKKVGYELDYKTLNAADFGVLQNRKRIILIGWRSDLNLSYPDVKEIDNKYLVSDLFQDLPALKPGEENNQYVSSPSQYLKDFQIRTKDDILTWHETRYHNKRDREIYRYAIRAWNESSTRIKYTDLPESLCTHENRTSFLDRFKVVSSDLPNSHTVVAHIAKDGHYYIHPDIKQARSISVREAARIQSFQDNYFFEGSRTSVFTQIGNAVPPLMSKAIAASIQKMLGI